MSDRGNPANPFAAVERDVPSLYDRVLGPVFFVDFADRRRTPVSRRRVRGASLSIRLMFVPDKDKAFREAHRVLAGGGQYLFSVWDSQRYNLIGSLSTGIAATFFPADPPRAF